MLSVRYDVAEQENIYQASATLPPSGSYALRVTLAACPAEAIKQLGPAAGKAEGTPVLVPQVNPCRWCTSMNCIEACPSGALAFGPDQTIRPIGKAVLNLETCLTQEGILCDECAQVCPTDVGAIRMVQREPQLDADRCVGCGLCAFHCASTPSSIKMTS